MIPKTKLWVPYSVSKISGICDFRPVQGGTLFRKKMGQNVNFMKIYYCYMKIGHNWNILLNIIFFLAFIGFLLWTFKPTKKAVNFFKWSKFAPKNNFWGKFKKKKKCV